MKHHLSSYCLALFLSFIVTINLYADIPAGYYFFANNKKGAELKTSLSEASYPTFVYIYGGCADRTWEGVYKTDR